MNITVIKRDGRKVQYNEQKIYDAIYKAVVSANGNDFDNIKNIVEKVNNVIYGSNTEEYSVEEIQDIVESTLIKCGHDTVAKNYILYRDERTRQRNLNSKLMKTYEDLTFVSSEDNDNKRENANIDTDTAMGTMLKYGSEGAKHFFKSYIIDRKFSKLHDDGDIHMHDLDFYPLTTTCCQIDLIKLFNNGFSTGHGFLREPNDIMSYSALACIAIQSNQNDQHGGQSVPNFEYAMAPGVKKTYKKLYIKNIIKAFEIYTDTDSFNESLESYISDLEKYCNMIPTMSENRDYENYLRKFMDNYITDEDKDKTINRIFKFTKKYSMKEIEKSTYQAMESLIHNLNTMHSRAGAQIPFSSINYGTDTSIEGRLVMKSLLDATIAGLGNGETPIFPIQIFKVKEGINYNPSDPNYDIFKLACKTSAKRLFPNFSFIDAPFNLQYYKEGDTGTEVAYMGCRTRVIANIYDKSKEIVYGRGNLSFTSINLPRIAIKSNGNMDEFYKDLEDKIECVIQQLLSRFKIQQNKKVKNYPFLMGQGNWLESENLGPDDSIEEVLKHGTLTVGFIGLAECLKALTGKHHGESEESQKIGLDIIGLMRKHTDEASKKYKLNFSLIGTPAEGLSGRFVEIDKKLYGIIEGVTDRDYYTNSFHIPVYYNISAFEKIKKEAPYHNLTNGGHISYIELDGDPSKNLEAFESIVRYMKESGIGYGSINHPVDRDPVCGYTGIIDDVCPRCGRRDGEAISEKNLIKLGLYKKYNSDTIGYTGNFKEEKDRVPNELK